MFESLFVSYTDLRPSSVMLGISVDSDQLLSTDLIRSTCLKKRKVLRCCE